MLLIANTAAAQNAEDIRDIRDPVVLPYGWAWLIILLGAVLLIAGGVVLYRYFARRRMIKEISAPPVPPWQTAFARLDALEQKQYPQKNQVGAYYTELSDILRKYIEARFDIQAPEMTTEEFLPSMGRSPEICDTHKQLLKDFLIRCDMVKFARSMATVSEMEEGLVSARNFIRETRRGEDEG